GKLHRTRRRIPRGVVGRKSNGRVSRRSRAATKIKTNIWDRRRRIIQTVSAVIWKPRARHERSGIVERDLKNRQVRAAQTAGNSQCEKGEEDTIRFNGGDFHGLHPRFNNGIVDLSLTGPGGKSCNLY